MFSVWESKGILRAATEEFILAARYKPDGPLFAEFIRTFRHHIFWGTYYLDRFDALQNDDHSTTLRSCLPRNNVKRKMAIDPVTGYGVRPSDPAMFHLSTMGVLSMVLGGTLTTTDVQVQVEILERYT